MLRAKAVMDATIQQQITNSVLSMTLPSISKFVFQIWPPNSIFIFNSGDLERIHDLSGLR